MEFQGEMNSPRILLGLTGSVASSLADKIVAGLQDVGEVKVMMTDFSQRFTNPLSLHKKHAVDVFTEAHEWSFGPNQSVSDPNPHHDSQETADGWHCYNGVRSRWEKGDKVLHIELRKWADVLVIAPISANTLAKMAGGLCDNLVSSVFRAWDLTRPVVVAPAMNTMMWDSPFTGEHLNKLSEIIDEEIWKPISMDGTVRTFHVAHPISRELACGDEGMGALARVEDIVGLVRDATRWVFPPHGCSGIPMGHHPGAFGFTRHKSHHTGVDLYVMEGTEVWAVEGGVVVGVQGFTGPKVGMDWWNDTDAILVEGSSGVVNYGEIEPATWEFPEGPRQVRVGDVVRRGDCLGRVIPVVKEGKERPDVPGHSRSMLHLELYPSGITEWQPWPIGQEEHSQIDPTQMLLDAIGAPGVLPEFEGEL